MSTILNQLLELPKTFAIEQSFYFKSAPERVFNALTEPKSLERWFLSKAKLVPKKGGSFSFNWIGGYHMTGNLKRFEPNKTVSFSWTDKLESGKLAKTLASFEVSGKGKGTLLRLHHTGFKDPEHFAECSSRWGYYLTNMKSVLDHRTD
ncbi:SRPBCC domain-containing protein, partial [Candidatus Bathyarchaeota archaeon]